MTAEKKLAQEEKARRVRPQELAESSVHPQTPDVYVGAVERTQQDLLRAFHLLELGRREQDRHERRGAQNEPRKDSETDNERLPHTR
jgi:hypothetical protein